MGEKCFIKSASSKYSAKALKRVVTLAYRLWGSVAAPLLALDLPLELRVVVPFELELAPPLSSREALDSSSEHQPLETGSSRAPPLLSSSLLLVEATFCLFFDLTFLLFF